MRKQPQPLLDWRKNTVQITAERNESMNIVANDDVRLAAQRCRKLILLLRKADETLKNVEKMEDEAIVKKVVVFSDDKGCKYSLPVKKADAERDIRNDLKAAVAEINSLLKKYKNLQLENSENELLQKYAG